MKNWKNWVLMTLVLAAMVYSSVVSQPWGP
ncbi:hypothetical protein QFZ81_000222 [Paenibacillus sp. V4I9]|nr:hypothetical protein [Paenibacillus sp. V4I9]